MHALRDWIKFYKLNWWCALKLHGGRYKKHLFQIIGFLQYNAIITALNIPKRSNILYLINVWPYSFDGYT